MVTEKSLKLRPSYVHLDPVLLDQQTKKIHLILEEFILLWRKVQLMFLQYFEHSFQMVRVTLLNLSGNEKIVDVNKKEIIVAIKEYLVHQISEGTRCCKLPFQSQGIKTTILHVATSF